MWSCTVEDMGSMNVLILTRKPCALRMLACKNIGKGYSRNERNANRHVRTCIHGCPVNPLDLTTCDNNFKKKVVVRTRKLRVRFFLPKVSFPIWQPLDSRDPLTENNVHGYFINKQNRKMETKQSVLIIVIIKNNWPPYSYSWFRWFCFWWYLNLILTDRFTCSIDKGNSKCQRLTAFVFLLS